MSAIICPVIIDFHTHVFPPRIRDNRSDYLQRDPCFALLYANPKSKLATAEELIASMDRKGISRSVILNLGWTSHQLCVESNDYILESAARHRGRLVAFCAVQPRAGEAAVAELERCARGGARGIGEMRPDLQGFDLGDRAVMGPVVEAASKHHLILLSHASEPVGHHYPGKGMVTPDMLYRFISAFPDVRLVCAHWGGGLPFYALMPEVASALANVFFDTAASPLLYRPQVFKQVIELVGAGKVLFGSDYPLVSQARALGEVQALGLPEELKAMIWGGNAAGLFTT